MNHKASLKGLLTTLIRPYQRLISWGGIGGVALGKFRWFFLWGEMTIQLRLTFCWGFTNSKAQVCGDGIWGATRSFELIIGLMQRGVFWTYLQNMFIKIWTLFLLLFNSKTACSWFLLKMCDLVKIWSAQGTQKNRNILPGNRGIQCIQCIYHWCILTTISLCEKSSIYIYT